MKKNSIVHINSSFVADTDWNDEPADNANGLHLYRVKISDHLSNVEDYARLLDAAELGRAARYHHKRDEYRFIVSRAVLRSVLSKKILSEPRDIRFDLSSGKKPYLACPVHADVQFNVAHSGEYILIAVAKLFVGADVEFIDREFDISSVMKFAFSNNEIEYITNAVSASLAFYTIWSRKEALLKGSGKGITEDLSGTSCLDGINKVESEVIGSDSDWSVRSFMVAPGYVGTIAYPMETAISFCTVKSLSVWR
jgi:4'-phosphopantetheinyl transferase